MYSFVIPEALYVAWSPHWVRFSRRLLVPTEGLEPPHLAAHGPEPCASTNSATWAITRKTSSIAGFLMVSINYEIAIDLFLSLPVKRGKLLHALGKQWQPPLH